MDYEVHPSIVIYIEYFPCNDVGFPVFIQSCFGNRQMRMSYSKVLQCTSFNKFSMYHVVCADHVLAFSELHGSKSLSSNTNYNLFSVVTVVHPPPRPFHHSERFCSR